MSGKVTKPKEEKDASKGIRVKRESDFRVVRLFCLPSRGPESFPNVTAELFSTVIDNDLNIISFTSKIRQEQAPSAYDLLWGQSPVSLQQTAGPKEGHWRDQGLSKFLP
ncbi:hypothetical protein JEQ12_020331 [Ovis aries]|uniref:Uncharacterized protein n=1 Tax=Ovis aries TaxID=9940 RepID=A0A835ZNX6_SHEEP|nr:hypothetical protein JEQ12_020331 [Ovis aries]